MLTVHSTEWKWMCVYVSVAKAHISARFRPSLAVSVHIYFFCFLLSALICFLYIYFANMSNAVCIILILLLDALDCFRPYFNDQSDSTNTLSGLGDTCHSKQSNLNERSFVKKKKKIKIHTDRRREKERGREREKHRHCCKMWSATIDGCADVVSSDF